MSDLLSQIVVAVILPVGALAARFLLQNLPVPKQREYVVELPEGRPLYIELSSKDNVREAVQREYDLQERVYNALSHLQEMGILKFERGRGVDFLVHLSDDSSVGIDIKTKFGKHAFKEVDSFIAGKLEVPKLILLVFDSIPPRLIRQTRDLTASGKIQLASITDSDTQSLETRLAALLGTTPANA
jgi:hypothetical protein